MVTQEFSNALKEKNLLSVRIMLKDSLLVDKSFRQFEEMKCYAEKNGVNFWMNDAEKIETIPYDDWNLDLLNRELAKLVDYFTKEQVDYCKKIIKKIYGSSEKHAKCSNLNNQIFHGPQNVGDDFEDYMTIAKYEKNIRTILERSKSDNGNIKIRYDDIDEICKDAKRIIKACKRIDYRKE